VIDEFGEAFECIDGFYSFESKPDKLYAYKTSKMYEYSNLFSLTLRFSYDSLENNTDLLENDFIEDQYLSINRGKIQLFYTNRSTSDNDQIIVIPVAYSDDWVFTDGKTYETISANGGFLGIVVPNDVSYVNISMKFVPKGLDLGALATAVGTLVYLGIFLPGWIRKKKEVDES
jgi:uncharacterized membrane protein YfhO